MSARSTTLCEYPHSLSYQAITLTMSSPITMVKEESTVEDTSVHLKSTETRGSSHTESIPLSSLSALSLKAAFTPNVSVVDLVIQVEKKTFAEEVNAAFRESADKELKGILSVCDEPLVSVDFRCTDVSSTVDSSLTMVMGDDMVKVIAWYDNEWGYSQRVVDLADIVANNWK